MSDLLSGYDAWRVNHPGEEEEEPDEDAEADEHDSFEE